MEAEARSMPVDFTISADLPTTLRYVRYNHKLEEQYLPAIRSLISKDLSEPYSIYVYRYFLCQWSHLCFLVSPPLRPPLSAAEFASRSSPANLAPALTFAQALHPGDASLIGVIVCKLEVHSVHSPPTRRGYIAMLAVSSTYRGHGIATALVKRAIEAMASLNADEVVLETEETNIPAMRLYERLGFLRSKKLHRYYLNGNSAYRLVLLLKSVGLEGSADFSDEDGADAIF